jgi:hypothetical protein
MHVFFLRCACVGTLSSCKGMMYMGAATAL